MDEHAYTGNAHKHNGEQQIHPWTGKGYKNVVHTRVPQIMRIDRDWFGPTDKKAAQGGTTRGQKDHEQWHHDGTDRIDMDEGIEGNTTLKARSIIAAFPGHPGVTKLMEGQKDEQSEVLD